VEGCDSIVTTVTTLLERYDIQLTATTCDPQNIGTVVQNLVSVEGCDSIVTTVTTLLESYDIQLTATTCDPQNVGTVVQNLVSVEGCDSIVTTVTTLLPSFEITLTNEVCNPADSGTSVLNLITIDGCDSVITIINVLVPGYIELPDTASGVCTDPVNQVGEYCIPIAFADFISGYDLLIDGEVYFDLPFICDVDSIGGYDFTTVINSNPSTYGGNTHILLSWEVNDVELVNSPYTYSTFTELASYLAGVDPQGNWTAIGDRVEGGFPYTNSDYGTVVVFSPQIGAQSFVNYNSGIVGKGTLIEDVPVGCHWFTLVNLQNPACTDSIYVCIECPDSAVTDTIYITVPIDEPTEELCGTGDDLDNTESSESLGCDVVLLEGSTIATGATGCITYTAGNVPGNFADTLCVVAHDGLGGTDTTVYIVTVIPKTDTIITPPDTVCIDFVTTVGGTVDTVYSCNGDDINVITDTLGCEVAVDVSGIVDGDTLCVVVCSGAICDTTIIIVTPIPPVTDTIYLTIPIDENTGELCGTGDDLDNTESSESLGCDVVLLEGSTITTGATGCITYTAGNVPGNFADTLCVVAHDGLGGTDTTVYIVTVIPKTDTIITPPDTVCIDFVTTVGGAVDTVYSCNGDDINVITDTLGCEVAVDVSGIVDGDTLCVVVCSGAICDTTIIIVTPIPPATDTIYLTIPIDENTGELCGTGDDLDNTESSESLGCDVVLLEGSTIATGATGCITYTAGNVPGNFADTLCVVAHDGLGGTDTTVYIVTVIPKTDTIITPPDTVCIDFVTTVGGTVDTVYSCNGDDINVITDTLGCEVAVDVSGIVDGDTLCVVVCSGAICDTTIIIVTPIPPATDTIYLTIPIDENTGVLCGTGDDIDNTESSESLGCDVVLLEGSTITTGATGCITYTAGNVPGNFADTLCVVAHDGLGGTDTTVYIVTVIPKTDTIITPPDTVCIDFVTTVGGTVDTVYSCNGDDINVITDTLGCEVAVDVSGIVDGDTLCVVVCSGAICDTTIIIVTPIPPATDTIYLTIPIDENTGVLCGTGDDLDNTESSESLGCDVVLLEGSTIATGATGCITYTAGNVPGNFADTLCVVAHDGLGGTDTTVYIVTVIPKTDTIITPPDTVCIDFVTTVGGTVDTVYSCNGDDINVITDTLGCEVAVDVSGIVDGDTLCVVVCSGAICDTTIIIVTPIPPVTDTIYLTIPIDENTGVLCGTGDDLDNTESSESLGCDVVLLEGSTIATGATGCITYTAGNVPGNFADTLCVVAHDGLGGTDTTVYIVTVIPKTDTIITPPDTICIDFVTTVGGTVDTVFLVMVMTSM
jgi:hypothetical protein